MNYEVYGRLEVHFKHFVDADSHNEATEKVEKLLNGIAKLDGDLYMKDGRELPIISDRVKILLYDVTREDEL
ncbi:hypothetical protein [Paenibacillus naphthalenovorans]|uniref:Uncharacterized protein n=1 Tax=Paenibacillus naphthalenovorans TaxID=162209 RepID=A0A0U2IM82_9BACL|nr:hypothetical protein [Paenibacillus naphthalenovorans]ALS22203.1 hypothetical protein IJ22_18290 [Paenibacillus naphthalenovorans]